MKKCKNCENEAHGRSGLCKPCKNEYNKVWYEKNKKRHLETVAKNNERYKAILDAKVRELKAVPCTDCGIQYDYWKMDFDHLPEFVKSFNIAERGNRSLQSVLEEIAKCEVVCKLCHADRTHFRGRQVSTVSR